MQVPFLCAFGQSEHTESPNAEICEIREICTKVPRSKRGEALGDPPQLFNLSGQLDTMTVFDP